ncbi:MAG: hypothetical protein JW821_12315, partial [Deltaproteobacteria bacterium]|nr:hypothetical protein [Deltaproteobacteria bacterium]
MYFLLINRRTKETIMNYSQMTPELVYQDIYNNMNQDVPRADRMSGGRPRRTGRLLYQHRQKMEQNKQEILYVIKSWINTKDAAFGRYLLGQKADLRVYTSRLNIARALIG